MPSFFKEPYPWPVLRITLDGLSAVDLPRLAIPDRADAHGFLRGYGFDLERARDRQRAYAIHEEALAFIRRHFLPGSGLTIPLEVVHPDDLADLLVVASRDESPGSGAQAWACSVLRVMHTIAHCDDDMRLRYFRDIRGQILDNYERHVVFDGDRLRLGQGHESVPLVSFRVKERKDRDSVIMKLLHKPSNIAEGIYDRIGVRLVTPTRVEALLALRYLRNNQVFSFANIQPEQSKNALVDLPRFLAALDSLDTDASDVPALALLEEAIAVPEDGLLLPENEPRQRNRHSLAGYRAIQFTARQRIRVVPKGRRRLKAASMVLGAARLKAEEITRRIETLRDTLSGKERDELGALFRDAEEGVATLAEVERQAAPVGFEEEVSFFFPYEVHILDEQSDLRNETGPASHTLYKKRQLETARRRVMGCLL